MLINTDSVVHSSHIFIFQNVLICSTFLSSCILLNCIRYYLQWTYWVIHLVKGECHIRLEIFNGTNESFQVTTICSKRGWLFHPFTAIYEACKIHDRVSWLNYQMSSAVGDIMAFLLNGDGTLQANFSHVDTIMPLITQLDTFHNQILY